MQEYIGAVDNQTIEQKEKNYKLAEVCAAISPVSWVKKSDWNRFPVRDQNGSLTCVCQTYATELGIIFKQKYGEWIDFSASFPYQQRGGTYGGCNSIDVYTNFPKIGNIFESFMPSQKMHEEEVLAVSNKAYYKDLAKSFTVKRIESPIDFETAASTVQATGKGVMVWFKFSSGEWTSVPQVLDTPTTSGHSVTIVDCLLGSEEINAKYGINLVIGKKYLVIQDSWGLAYAINGYRFISEEYFKARCFLVSYLKTFQTLTAKEEVEKPIFNGTVKSLQEILIYEGFLAVGLNTNYFGTLTKNALILFQKAKGISPALGNFGPITKQYLLDNYK